MPSRGFLAMWMVVVVAVVAALAILTYGFLNLGRIRGPQESEESPTFEDSQVKELKTLSDSDEINVIESELNSTNVENLDAGFSEEVTPLGF